MRLKNKGQSTDQTPKVFGYKRDIGMTIDTAKKPLLYQVLAILLCLSLIFVGFLTGVLTEKSKTAQMLESNKFLFDLAEFIKKNYYKDVTDEQLTWYAAQGMVAGLDKYSVIYEEDTSSGEEYGRFGLAVSYDVCGEFRVEWVEYDSPAFHAGVKVGDYIYSVNDVKVEGDFTSTFTALVGNKKVGESIKLYFCPEKGGKNGKIATLVAENKEKNYVRTILDFSEFGLDIDEKIGYVLYEKFDQGSAEQLRQAFEQFRISGKTKLILDLRGNPGGDGDVLTQVASMLLDNETHGKDIPIICLNYKDGTKYEYKTYENNYIFKGVEGGEIVVLVNGSTASASEALVGAMLVQGVAEIVGTTTYGKGVAQNIVNYPVGAKNQFKLKLTVGEYNFYGDVSEYVLGASGYVDSIHGKGFTPKGENNLVFNRVNSLFEDNQFLRAVSLLSD